MHNHTHPSTSPAQTEGRLIPWVSFYDALVNIMTLGQIHRLRNMTIEQTLLKPGESILDVGCGTGEVTIPGKKRVGQTGMAAGIDPDPQMIAIAQRKATRAALKIDFRIGVIESLPYPDAAFDAVTSSLMMHHLPHDLQAKGLAEIYRVLKPGGRLLIADMMRSGGSMRKQLFASIAFHPGQKFGIEDLPEMLKISGFQNVHQLDEHFLVIGFVRATKPGV